MKRTGVRALCAAALFASLGSFLSAATVHVATTGSDTTGTGTQANPYKTIQKGLDMVVSGETVLVADGVYTGGGNIELTWNGLAKHITLRSAGGPYVCVIDCGKVGRAFHFDNTGQTAADRIIGFGVVGGYSTVSGGALYADGVSPTLINCVFSGNATTQKGGAIYCSSSTMRVEGCVFAGNSANTALEGGAVFCDFFASPVIVNCIIVGNRASLGAGVHCDYASSPVIVNATIAGNGAMSSGGGLSCSNGCSPALTNTILYGNTAGGAANQTHLILTNSDPVVSYSAVEGGAEGITGGGSGAFYTGWGVGNVTADPKFTGGASGTWTSVVYDTVAHRTTFTDTAAAFPPGTLAALFSFIRPDTLQPFQYPIIANDAHSISVWGDYSSVAVGAAYTVLDYRPANGSPCVDVGLWDLGGGQTAPASDQRGNPRYDDTGIPNGGAAGSPPVDMGALEKQTNSPVDEILGDINTDGVLTIADAILCLRMALGFDPPDVGVADMDSDGEVTVADAVLIIRLAAGLS